MTTLESPEWSRHWPVPIVSALALAVSTIPLYSLGALMPAIHASTGWSRSQITVGPTIISFVTVCLSPFVGSAIDRFGPRRIGLPGLVFYCAAVASIAFAGVTLHTWWLAWSLVAIAYASVKMTVWTAAVVSLFQRARGLALGVTLAGLGITSTLLPAITTWLDDKVGWHDTYLWLGAGGFLLAVPLVFLFFRSAEGSARIAGTETFASTRPAKAFLSRRYLQMSGACLCAAIPSTAFVVHFVPILRSGGMKPHVAAVVAGAIGITSIVGRLAGGFLLDRISAPFVGFVSCALPVLSGPLLLMSHSVPAAVFAASMIGLSAGSEIGVLAYLVPRYFGTRHFGLLFGIMNALITVGLGVGPLLAARLFDFFGNYNNFLLLTVPLFALSAILLGTLGEPEAASLYRVSTSTSEVPALD